MRPSDMRIDDGVAYIKLTKGKEAMIDAIDLPKVNHLRWRQGGAYAITGQHPHLLTMQFLICRPVPEGKEIDHRDGNGLNNRRNNLRICTRQENLRNKRPKKNSRLGIKGVVPLRNGRFAARIRFDDRDFHLGSFSTIEEADVAYQKKAAELFGEYAWHKSQIPQD